jgi:hypothetical protein
LILRRQFVPRGADLISERRLDDRPGFCLWHVRFQKPDLDRIGAFEDFLRHGVLPTIKEE